MHIRSFLLGAFTAVVLTGAFAIAQDNKLGDMVLAIVKGEKITQRRLAVRLLEYHGKDGLEKMTNRVLLMQEVRRIKVGVTKEEIDERVELVRGKLGGKENYEKFLANNDLTAEQHHLEVRYTLLLEKCALKTSPITDDDLNRYLVRVILCKDKPEAETVIKLAGEGKDFGQLAFAYSTDKATGRQGGILKAFIKTDLLEIWRKAIQEQKLKPGDYTKAPVFLGRNFSVVKLERVLLGRDLSKSERERWETRLTGYRMDQLLGALRENATISYPVQIQTAVKAAKADLAAHGESVD